MAPESGVQGQCDRPPVESTATRSGIHSQTWRKAWPKA
ncbi:Uncharacterised protein [Pseudomonas aeruginosa]|nr:Uncharacterised protein [Pseudomonas aeruginosa]